MGSVGDVSRSLRLRVGRAMRHDPSSPAAGMSLERRSQGDATTCHVRCTGAFTLPGIVELDRRVEKLAWPSAGEVIFDMAAVSALDTSGAWLLHRTTLALKGRGLDTSIESLRPEAEALMRLIASRMPGQPVVERPRRPGMLAAIGRKAWTDLRNVRDFVVFVGQTFTILLRSLAQPRRIRWRTVMHNVQAAGFDALPITGLLSFLMGIVIAYQGADQLKRFGANLFVADLVGIAMLRELSPLLTAIIVAGRSGSAYTAQIGTMVVTEEIDALRTVGVVPHELLVLPKMLALVIVLPLLTVYTDIAGVAGGMLMARAELGLSFDVFLDRLREAIAMSTYLTGLSKAPVFATIIALVGCFRGFQTSGGAASVGAQTTTSVVQAIFLVIVTDALFSVVFNMLDL
ncbi:MAG: MlaE family lipid ABC transporter permease subunit [Betaproteobacteria bacterium]|jgi:phospholipid/cholesterol/gamma-HCH transport system permease protein